MNTSEQDPIYDNELFERLVDDELSASQRRELLRALDQVPDGWRRCALAFLEAQCWRKELGAMARETEQRHQPAPPARRARSMVLHWGTLLAMAASFLVALGLGVLWRDAQQAAAPGPSRMVGAVAKSERPALADSPATGPGRAPAWQMVTLAGSRGQGGGEESIRLPAVETDRFDEGWLNSLPEAIPPEVVRALKNTGHEVRQSRQLVPLKMRDGRRLFVPLDEVDVHYVGRPTY